MRGLAWSFLAAAVLALPVSASAASYVYLHDGSELFRYRAGDEQTVITVEAQGRGAAANRTITVGTNAPSLTGAGCDATATGPATGFSLTCARSRYSSLVYSLILGPFDDRARAPASDPNGNLGGVIHLGAGDDDGFGYRVYGGPGRDTIKVGLLANGGPGSDRLTAPEIAAPATFLRGGTGDDLLHSASPVVKPALIGGHAAWLWAGPGDDLLVEQGGGEMLVAGPGRDRLQLDGYVEHPTRPNVVRTRDGQPDTIRCSSRLERHVLYVDRVDRLSGTCQAATILYAAKPLNPQTAGDILELGGSLTNPSGERDQAQ